MSETVVIMPCLDMQNGRVVKGVHFVDIADAGDPVECAKAYCAAGADELALLEKAKAEGEDLPLFFTIWCARESYAKYTGDGVAGMDKNYSTTDSPVPLYTLPFRAGYSLTLCTDF